MDRKDWTRRNWLRACAGSLAGVSASGWLAPLAQAAASQGGSKACIVLWMSGGPSQTDTFDLKPGHENGGPFAEIATSVPGLRISEHLPKLAAQAQELAILRGMTSKEGDHGRATQLMQTGYRPEGGVAYPSLGALVSKELGASDHDLPNYISIGAAHAFGSPGAGFLGPRYAPLSVSGDSDDADARANLAIENLTPPAGMRDGGLRRRAELLAFLEEDFARRVPDQAAEAHRTTFDRAARMVESQARQAFALDQETEAVRDAFGRNRFGQGCLLARRLVERGVPFVEVTLGRMPGSDLAWDTHNDNFSRVRRLCEVLDPAYATLLADLKRRGLLESTLVVWMGEFGRTPQINGQTGRDHYPAAWSTVLAGAGVRGGQAVGNTGKTGMEVEDRGIRAADFFATICTALGIDYRRENHTSEGRPISIVEQGASPLAELVG